MKTRQNIKIEMTSRKGNTVYSRCVPERLEYSEKDDKFRLVTSGCRFIKTINISRITKCKIYNGETNIKSTPPTPTYERITLKVRDERNALERCLLHFAHFEKRAERVDDYYLLHIKFNHDDEPEMVIRVLSFGPMVEVLESESFKKLINSPNTSSSANASGASLFLQIVIYVPSFPYAGSLTTVFSDFPKRFFYYNRNRGGVSRTRRGFFPKSAKKTAKQPCCFLIFPFIGGARQFNR